MQRYAFFPFRQTFSGENFIFNKNLYGELTWVKTYAYLHLIILYKKDGNRENDENCENDLYKRIQFIVNDGISVIYISEKT